MEKLKTARRTYHLYPNLGYWFLSFILLVAVGFYNTYFNVFFEPKHFIVHLHFALMATWVLMLITQPFLIKFQKNNIHRVIGKLSYILVPCLVMSSFLMTRFAYHNYISEPYPIPGLGMPETPAAIHKGASIIASLPFIYIIWLATLYILAISNREKSSIHGRYMLATAMTILGPTIDRILVFVLKMQTLPFGIPVETFAFILIDIILFTLALKDSNRKRKFKTLRYALGIYLLGQILYFTIFRTDTWSEIMNFLMEL